MTPEWKKRIVAISVAAIYAHLARLGEPFYPTEFAAWITRACGIFVLLAVLAIADKTRPEVWERVPLEWPLPTRRGIILTLAFAWFMARPSSEIGGVSDDAVLYQAGGLGLWWIIWSWANLIRFEMKLRNRPISE